MIYEGGGNWENTKFQFSYLQAGKSQNPQFKKTDKYSNLFCLYFKEKSNWGRVNGTRFERSDW